MVIKRKLPPKKGLMINPFCILCYVDIVKDLVASKKNIFVGDWLMEKLNTLRYEIWEEVESLKKQGGQSIEHEGNILKQIEIPDIRLDRIVSDRVCNEDEFEACVAANNDRVFEEKILVIKGLQSLSIDDDDVGAFLKREDMCGICLQKLKTTDSKEGEDYKAVSFIKKWSKSLGKLPCEHVFHEPCILRWLYKNNVCPFCRNSVNV
ncbi:E3 ubiquitin-protein ligase Praja-2-like [Chenopodium quinoa]|uniref:E3 ubiquitin-protein ligase Praja-2-like n=1 Tax=Chenopodium quinoa TaxID=63459 RepID=UPI000B7804AC|nr:E3 ubiquitin-protein ligase Praja-2-like [Chenopodium quinoa]